MLMEVWHWTPLVALLAYAGLRAIPDVYYQAAKIDGASPWATFWYIQLPKMRGVLTIALLLRFMDSFLIYAEPFVLTGGGPGNTTTFLSIYLVKLATGQFDLGTAGSLLPDLLINRYGHLFCVLPGTAKRGERSQNMMKGRKKTIALAIYFILMFLPIYWMLNMSLRTNADILGTLTIYPVDPTFANYIKIFTDSSWYMGYVNSIIYVTMNTLISLTVALPAAYAFSRYQFVGDTQVFFWLLTNRMAPAAVFLLPFFQLYSTIGLLDTHIAVALAHCLFNVPLAVWILEGFMSGIPREIDETAFIDGYSLPRFFITIFIPLIRAGVGVTAFFCFMFSWVELLFARTLTITNAKPIQAVMTRTISATGMDWGLLAAAGVLTIVPGALVIWFVRNHMAKGFALGRV